jgi:plastocyanin
MRILRLTPAGIRRLLGALLAVFLASPAPSRAGTISGTITLTPADLSFRGGIRQNAYVGQLSGSAARSASADPSDTTYGVAYLSDVDAAGDPVPDAALLDQKGQRFIPRILAVVVGQAVDFRNSDNVFHNVFSYSPPKRFDLGRYPRGKSKRLTFQKPGEVQVFCDIHSDMRADIVVVPSRRFGYVDADGRFRIEGAPSGRHTVVVWLPRRGERTAEVDIPAGGAAALALGAE